MNHQMSSIYYIIKEYLVLKGTKSYFSVFTIIYGDYIGLGGLK